MPDWCTGWGTAEVTEGHSCYISSRRQDMLALCLWASFRQSSWTWWSSESITPKPQGEHLQTPLLFQAEIAQQCILMPKVKLNFGIHFKDSHYSWLESLENWTAQSYSYLFWFLKHLKLLQQHSSPFLYMQASTNTTLQADLVANPEVLEALVKRDSERWKMQCKKFTYILHHATASYFALILWLWELCLQLPW